MSRMPGRGVSPSSCVIGSALCGQSWRREWRRVAAERPQLLGRGAKFQPKGVEASVRDRHKAFYFYQIDCLARAAARDEGTYQSDSRQKLRDPGPADRRRNFRTEQGAIET